MKNNFLLGLISGIIIILVYKFGLFGLLSSETSFKMSGVEPRYVSHFRYTPIYKGEEQGTLSTGGELYKEKIKAMLPKIESLLGRSMNNESIHLSIADLGNFPILIKVLEGKITIIETSEKDFSPSIVFRVQKADIDGLAFFLQDGKLNAEEQLKVADVILPAMTERVYRTKKLYKHGSLSAFGFDDLMQIEIKHPEGINRLSVPLSLRVTIANIDGQWIVTPGFVGDPDVRFSLSLEDALKIYQLITIDLENAETKQTGIAVGKDIFAILSENQTYVRKDHE
ncbi:MAG: hypothetical protein U0518_00065 [Candidatus Gracilibacteria bacterium]